MNYLLFMVQTSKSCWGPCCWPHPRVGPGRPASTPFPFPFLRVCCLLEVLLAHPSCLRPPDPHLLTLAAAHPRPSMRHPHPQPRPLRPAPRPSRRWAARAAGRSSRRGAGPGLRRTCSRPCSTCGGFAATPSWCSTTRWGGGAVGRGKVGRRGGEGPGKGPQGMGEGEGEGGLLAVRGRSGNVRVIMWGWPPVH